MSRFRSIASAAALALALAGCGRRDDDATVTINVGDDGIAIGNLAKAIGADGGMAGGAVKVDVPGFKGEFALPKMKLDANDFDLNGVRLYPGSSVTGVNLNGRNEDRGERQGDVRIAFASPGTPVQVRDWYRERLAKVGFTLRDDGTGLAGRTDEGKPFRLDLVPDAGTRAKGTITIGS